MSRRFPIGSFKTGITRLRDKGGPAPDSLFDLVNGYVNAAGAPVGRFGTTLQKTLPAGTKGLCIFKGKRHVFAMTAIDPGSTDYVVDILIHPDPSFVGTLVAIHFAKPFLGYLYVVAEFSDGQIFHYWLQSSNAWQASTTYLSSSTVRPTSVNGFIYRPTTQNNPAAWAANTAYAVGDQVQPTSYNGYAYQVIEADGDTPSSGATEPAWVASDGAVVYEDVDNTPAPPTSGSGGSSPGGSRYDNLPGFKGTSGTQS